MIGDTLIYKKCILNHIVSITILFEISEIMYTLTLRPQWA